MKKLIILLVFAAACIAVVMVAQTKVRELKKEAADLDSQIAAVQEHLQEIRASAVETKIQKLYNESNAHKEELARNWLNMIYEGDRVYVIE